jgi:hypothetical protein
VAIAGQSQGRIVVARSVPEILELRRNTYQHSAHSIRRNMSRNRRLGDCLQIMVQPQEKSVESDIEFLPRPRRWGSRPAPWLRLEPPQLAPFLPRANTLEPLEQKSEEKTTEESAKENQKNGIVDAHATTQCDNKTRCGRTNTSSCNLLSCQLALKGQRLKGFAIELTATDLE